MDEKLEKVINLLENRVQHLLADYEDLKKAFDEMHDAFQSQVLLNEELTEKVKKMQQENNLLKVRMLY